LADNAVVLGEAAVWEN